jgi:glycogen operon protein
MLATLFLSQGVPMLLAGDEIGRTQRGNNNAYCQDNELSWVDWEHADRDLLDFVTRLIHLRLRHPNLRRRGFFEGQPIEGTSETEPDIAWYTPAGSRMSHDDWQVGYARSLAVFLNGRGIRAPDPHGERVVDDTFVVLCNANPDAMAFTLAAELADDDWEILVDTARPESTAAPIDVPTAITVNGFSLVLLRRLRAGDIRVR